MSEVIWNIFIEMKNILIIERHKAAVEVKKAH